MWNLKYGTDTYETNRPADIENRVVVMDQEGEGRMDWEFGISRCKLLYIEWINNKVQLYSTGNYIQYPVINHKGKYMKKNILVYV